jgi:hypothetical protein
MAIEELVRQKSPCIDQIPAELFKAGGRTVHFEIHKLCSKEAFPEEWKKLIIVLFIRRVIKQILVIIKVYHFCQLHTNVIQWG